MDFQIKALPKDQFAHLFALTDEELAARKARRVHVSEYPGTPCRVSLQDAEVGETVMLLNYAHQTGDSPYHATHAIFVREHAVEAVLAPNTIPEAIRSRLVSLRLFDAADMMIDAEVLPGAEVGTAISKAFERSEVAYAHIHNAKPGCFAASAHRVPG